MILILKNEFTNVVTVDTDRKYEYLGLFNSLLMGYTIIEVDMINYFIPYWHPES